MFHGCTDNDAVLEYKDGFFILGGGIKKNPTICLSYGGEGYKDRGICDV
jgi:hypothetical protein